MSTMQPQRGHGFTLVEILIVVVILGILAGIVIPQITNASEGARSSSLLSQLKAIRGQLELYQVQHNGSYPDLFTNWDQMTQKTDAAGNLTSDGDFGPYLPSVPVNPFTESATVKMGASSASADVGWVVADSRFKAVMPQSKYDELFPDGSDKIVTYSDSGG